MSKLMIEGLTERIFVSIEFFEIRLFRDYLRFLII